MWPEPDTPPVIRGVSRSQAQHFQLPGPVFTRHFGDISTSRLLLLCAVSLAPRALPDSPTTFNHSCAATPPSSRVGALARRIEGWEVRFPLQARTSPFIRGFAATQGEALWRVAQGEGEIMRRGGECTAGIFPLGDFSATPAWAGRQSGAQRHPPRRKKPGATIAAPGL